MSQRILLTGATDGIGFELARELQARGCRVVLVGRRALETLDPEVFNSQNYLRADLSHPHFQDEIVHGLKRLGLSALDTVVHNAGLGYVGSVSSQDADSIEELFRVNLWAPIALTRALCDDFLVRGSRVVFVSSVVTNLATPKFAVYGACKAGLEAFARSLRLELEPDVMVQVIRPGATRTGMHRKAGMPSSKTSSFADPAIVARELLMAMESGKREVTLGWKNKILRLAGPPMSLVGALKTKTKGYSRSKTAFITGGADGIGRALVQEYLTRGWRVSTADRNRELLEGQKHEADAAGQDLRVSFGDFLQSPILGVGGTYDLIIHNAGINATGSFRDQDLELLERVLRLNFLVPMLWTSEALRQGCITPSTSLVFISSLSHFVSYPGASVYAASKGGLAHYASSMRWMKGLGPVLTVYPGPTRTAHARQHSPDNSKEHKRMCPRDLALQISEAQKRRSGTLIPGGVNLVAALFGSLFPRAAERFMKRSLYQKIRARPPQ